MKFDYFKFIDNKSKIKQVLNQLIPEIYDFEFNGDLYLIGGAIKNILMGENFKDIDIVIISNENRIKSFINEKKLSYEVNSFGGYKIKKDTLMIDMWTTNDLYKAMEYTYDGLFYNIYSDLLIPCGFTHSIENKVQIKINTDNIHPIENKCKRRTEKIKNIIEQLN